MMRLIRHTLVSMRDLWTTAAPVLLLGIGLLVLAYWVLDPTPPRRMVLASGPERGAYAEFARQYAEALARHGITVELRTTQGSAENLALLQSGAVDAAFVQGGADRIRPLDEAPPQNLLSLGSLFLEPVWLFYRESSALRSAGAPQIDSLRQLAGWRVNIGTEGSGVTNLMLRLLQANGIEPQEITALREPPTPAVMAVLEDRADAVAFVSAPESPLVQMLLITPGIRLFDFAQAEAYSRRVSAVRPTVLPRGVVDLARDLPPTDIRLVAPTAALVVREGTHPALQQLLVQASHRLHGEAGWFQRKGEFPQAVGGEFALAPEAERYFRSGAPALQRYLPFWLANLIDRMWVVLLSIVAVLIPLSRVVPPLYEFRIRSRIFRWYAQLRSIEQRLGAGARGAAASGGAAGASGREDRTASPAVLLDELNALDARVERLVVPLSHADELYALRSHIHLVRKKVMGLRPGAPAGEEDPVED